MLETYMLILCASRSAAVKTSSESTAKLAFPRWSISVMFCNILGHSTENPLMRALQCATLDFEPLVLCPPFLLHTVKVKREDSDTYW